MEIKKVLMRRDGLTSSEADAKIEEVKEMMEDAVACGDYDEVEDIMASELGLEMDYIWELI